MLPWVRANEGVELGPGIKERMSIAGEITKEEAEVATTVRAEYVAAVRAMLPPGTVMVVPSAPCTVSARCMHHLQHSCTGSAVQQAKLADAQSVHMYTTFALP